MSPNSEATAAVICWGSGSPMREFLHADDLGKACIFALEHWSIQGSNAPCDESGQPLSFLNVGTGIDLSIRQLAMKISRLLVSVGKFIGT